MLRFRIPDPRSYVGLTSFSSSGGSWARPCSLLRLWRWLWWKREKSAALLFSRYSTRPRLGTREEAAAGSADERSVPEKQPGINGRFGAPESQREMKGI